MNWLPEALENCIYDAKFFNIELSSKVCSCRLPEKYDVFRVSQYKKTLASPLLGVFSKIKVVRVSDYSADESTSLVLDFLESTLKDQN